MNVTTLKSYTFPSGRPGPGGYIYIYIDIYVT